MDENPLKEHWKRLNNMYQAAPINELYPPTLNISEGEAVLEIETDPKYFHAAGAVHGSVYFKVLDDAAFFAANSLEADFFVLTTSFTTYLTRPVSEGKIRSVGKVVNKNKSQFIAEAIAYDDNGNEIGRGNGVFVRSKMKLMDIEPYAKPI